jgi:hypothetical protein
MKYILPFLLLACSESQLLSTEKNIDEEDDTEQDTDSNVDLPDDPGECHIEDIPAEELPDSDACPSVPEGGFTPIIEWSLGNGKGCLALPTVGDINQDGMPDVVINLSDMFNGAGTLVVASGDGSGEHFRVNDAKLGYGSSLALGDINNDGVPEIVGVREHASGQFFTSGDYTVVAWDNQGNELWESEHYINIDFNWATGPILADMNGDGNTEIIAGRVILNNDGTTRGVGEHGVGSYGITNLGEINILEGSLPAVTDLDLDGQMEIIVGNAHYDIDGNTLFYDPTAQDAMISVANLDDDPEGEYVGISGNTIRAMDTDGSIMWGPITFPAPANILSPAAIADIDGDGYPEILTAGGNELRAINHDGTTLWAANVVDETGATGASIFDFEGDGIPDVVYIDEIKVYAFDGPTGGIKFQSDQHASNTMMDYPVIADVDNDDQAEILVCHNGYSEAFSVYGDLDESWMPARSVWNQHAYHINNINDDLSIPSNPLPSFEHSNTWHSGVMTTADAIERSNVEAEILDVCTDECEAGELWLSIRLKNTGETAVPSGTMLSIYGLDGAQEVYIATITLPQEIEAGWSSASFQVGLYAEDIEGMNGILARADDDGTGTGILQECSELDNAVQADDAFCP